MLTQFFLKQSCEQKKLSLMPSFRQVGHCNEPASLGQSTPRHFLFVGGSSAISASDQRARAKRSQLRFSRRVSKRTVASRPEGGKSRCAIAIGCIVSNDS
jgi:hypothetical protein